MAQIPESEEVLLQTLKETAETGLFTQQFGEFLTGTVPPFHLFQFLVGLNMLPEEAQRQFLHLLQTFETKSPGVQQVSFIPQEHHLTIAAAVQNLMLNIEDFRAGMEINNESNKYSIVLTSADQTVESIMHNSHPLSHPSEFSHTTRRYLETHLPPSPSGNSFYARRAHDKFLQSKPFIRISVENRTIAQMTVGFGLTAGSNTGHPPIPLPSR